MAEDSTMRRPSVSGTIGTNAGGQVPEDSYKELESLLAALMDGVTPAPLTRTSSQDSSTSDSSSGTERRQSAELFNDFLLQPQSSTNSDDTKSTEDSGPHEDEEEYGDDAFIDEGDEELEFVEVDEEIATEVMTEEERRSLEESQEKALVEWEWRIFYPRCDDSPTLLEMFRNLAWDNTAAEIREDSEAGRSIFMLNMYCPDLQITCDVSAENTTAMLRPRVRLQKESHYNCEAWVFGDASSLLKLNAKTRRQQVVDYINQTLTHHKVPTAKTDAIVGAFKPNRDVLEIRCRKIQTSLYQSLINESDQLVAAQTDFDVIGDQSMGTFRSIMLRSTSLQLLHRVLENNNIPTRSTEGDVEGWPEFLCNLWKRGKRMPIFLRTSSTRIFRRSSNRFLLERQGSSGGSSPLRASPPV